MPLYRQFTTRAQLDAEYDVDNSVPNFAEYVELLLRKSAEARDTLTHHLQVPYGPSVDERLDIFPASPTPDEPAPVLVFFHGGYWRQLTAAEFDFVALGLARAGITVVIPTYSLCPKAEMDEIVRQARAAVAWTARKCFAFGGDPERVFVGGHSAGGHLAVMTALTDWEIEYAMPHDIVKGVAPISGLFDLTPLPLTCVGPSLRLTPMQVARNSPLLLPVPAGAPPMLVSWGGGETAEFQRQSRDMVAHWRAGGAKAEPFAQGTRDHFAAMLDLMDPDAPLTRKIAELMGAEMGAVAGV